MNSEARRAAAAALTALAASSDYRDRADAGRALASFAELPEARPPLLNLVLDTADTFVTRVTAEALLRRQDAPGLTVVASALTAADDSHADWIQTAVLDVFGVFAQERDDALQVCEAMTRDSDERVRRDAAHLARTLAAISPVLYPLAHESPEGDEFRRGSRSVST
jgi:hypothetical protein